jgi:ABC-2 type transport system permease protein
MNRMFAIIEREMRKFFRSPTLMIMSLMMPILQLVIMGNAFGGKIVGAGGRSRLRSRSASRQAPRSL